MANKIDNQRRQSDISLIAAMLSLFLNICIGFFISPLIVRDLGVEANGFAQLANNFVSYASLITIALNAMAARFITISYHKGEIQKAREYYSSAFIGNVFAILFLVIPAAWLVFNIDRVVTIQTSNANDVKVLFALTFMNFFLSNISSVYNISTTVKNKHYLSSLVTMVGSVIRVSILIVLFKCFEVKLFYVSLAALVVAFISLLEYSVIKRRLVPDLNFSIKAFKLSSMKDLLLSGIWSVVNKCGDLLMTGFDLLLTNVFIGPIQMGVLSVAKTIPTHLISIASTASWNWNPKMTKEYAEGNTDKMLETLDSSAKITSLLVAIPTMIFTAFSYEFYKLWMPTQNAKELAILSILTVMAYFILAGPSNVYNIFTITNRLKVNSVSYIVGAVISMIISIVMIKFTSRGIYAVAGVSSLIVIIRNLVFLLPYAAKCIGKKWYTFYKYVIYNGACSVIVAVAAAVVKILLPMNSWLSFLLACCVAGLTSLLALFFVMVDKRQKSEIYKNLLRIKIISSKRR